MCGRFVQTSSPERLATLFGATDTITDAAAPHRARHNVAPTSDVPAVVEADGRRLGLLRWGFVPAWSRDPGDGPQPINARVEGVATSRLFGPCLGRQRCIVPIDGWYEWQALSDGKQPWLLRPPGDVPVAVAGVWSRWTPRPVTSESRTGTAGTAGRDAPRPDGGGRGDGAGPRSLVTVALLTTAARGAAAEVHDRMPLIVPDQHLDAWLERSDAYVPALLDELAGRTPQLEVFPVSRRVNSVRNDDPSLLEPVELGG
jgi:putative SOS response-associated peptidase YedK